ncbi:MAG: CBS domain-containing protein, partial [Acidimicrobiales bacterium]
DQPVSGVRMQLAANPEQRRQRIYPVLDDSGEMTGIVTGSDLFTSDGAEGTVVEELQRPVQATAWEDETLRNAAERMAEGWIGALPVVKRDDPNSVVGVITEFDLLKARQRQLEEERHRERILWFRRNVPRPLAEEGTAPSA